MKARLLALLLPFVALACLAGPEDPIQRTQPPELPPGAIEASAPEILILPFSTRMSKLSHVLDTPVSDPLFTRLYEQRYALGDHDYARALRPDRRWSSRRMAIWIDGLQPICGSTEFRALYPNVAASPDAFVARAYGRPIDDGDRQSLNGDDTSVCLAVLSSLEFVIQ